MTKTTQAVFCILSTCILGAATALTMALISPPPPQPADAPATTFSAERALQDLAVIAREPHPMGVSRAHADARDYLLAEIRALGLEPQVQESFGLRVVHPGWVTAGAVENVLVRLPGTDPAGAVLLMSHYDSAPGVPGAVDSGSGVVAVLELLRALRAGPPLRHDVIALFTDGEEPGTIGAHAFVAQHPWFRMARVVLNLEQFWEGPPLIFRTTPGNGALFAALARTSPRPAYVSLPFHLFPGGDTDVLPFLAQGVAVADIMTASGPLNHTALDRVELVDPASLQQGGSQVLALVRYLGNQPTLELGAPDETFFPVLGRLVHYPASWALPLGVVAGLCTLGTLFYGLHTGRLTWRGLGLGTLALLLSLAVSVGIAVLLWLGLQALHPEYALSALRPHVSDDHLYGIGFIALALAVSAFAIATVRRSITALDLAGGALVVWLPGAVAAAILVPASSYLASWTLLAGSLALLLASAVRTRRLAWAWSGLGFLCSAVLAAFLWIPVIQVAILGSGLPLLSMIVGLAALWLGSMFPVLDWITSPTRWILPVAALLAGVGFLLAGHLLVGRDSPPPLVNPIGYWVDADAGRAYWVAFTEQLDERQAGLLLNPLQRPYTELLPEAPRYTVQTSPAPMLDLAGPHLSVVRDAWVGDRRQIQVRVTTSMHDRLYLIVPRGVSVLGLALPYNERAALPPCDGEFVLRFDGMPVDGFEVELELDTPGPLQFLVVEERTGLPAFAGLSTQPQPGTMRTPGEFRQGIPTDFTAINRDFAIPGAAR